MYHIIWEYVNGNFIAECARLRDLPTLAEARASRSGNRSRLPKPCAAGRRFGEAGIAELKDKTRRHPKFGFGNADCGMRIVE